MFTGLVSAVGTVAAVVDGPGLRRLTIECSYDAASIPLGASICHDGVCLTVVDVASSNQGARYSVEVAAESLAVTTLGRLSVDDRVNLERSLRLGDELGGHIVSGHVDGLGSVASITPDGAGWRIEIDAPASIAGLIAAKGSIAVNGVSLTVNAVAGRRFGVLIIPHTWTATTLSDLKEGDAVNLEADMLARYVARSAAYAAEQKVA